MSETKKAYRAYVLDVTKPLAPVVHVVHIAAVDYATAWKIGRAALDADKRGKNVIANHAAVVFTDEARTTQFASSGKAFTFVRCDDATPRNAKLDVKAVAATLASGATDAEKLAALAAQFGVALPAAK